MELKTNTSVQHRPALRLVSTKGMSREEWLKVRQNGIGSSDAAAAVGLNPYQSQLELWMIKTGRDHSIPKPDPEDQSSPMYWGNVLEPIVAEHYSKRTGRKVRRINAVLQHPDPDKAWMLANLDYGVVGNREVQILECKTAGQYGAKLWKHGVPDYIQCQVQHQLAVTGKQAADVGVLLCGQDLQIFRIDRDDELIERLIELEQQFWRYVETDTPPPADGSDSAELALRHLYPQDAEQKVVDFREDSEMSEIFDQLVRTRAEVSAQQKQEAALKQRIQERMEDAATAKFLTGIVSWKRSQDSQALDTPRLRKTHPKLLEQFTVTKPGSRRFTVHANTR